jgi:hypothetical protein
MKKTGFKLLLFVVVLFSFIAISRHEVNAQSSGGSFGTPSKWWGTSEGWSTCERVTAAGSTGCYQYRVQQYYILWMKSGPETPVTDGNVSDNQRSCNCP